MTLNHHRIVQSYVFDFELFLSDKEGKRFAEKSKMCCIGC